MELIKAVLFDLDGTLVDQKSASEPAVREWATELGVHGTDVVDRWRIISSRHYERYQRREITFQEQRRERVREFLGSEFEAREADELFSGYLWRYEERWSIFPDAIPCLERARSAGLSLGVLTNGDRTQQMQKIYRFRLADHFDEIVCSSDLSRGKPHSDAFDAAVSALGHAPSMTLMVGDDIHNDARGAIRAGLAAVLLDRDGTFDDSELHTVATLDELTFAY